MGVFESKVRQVGTSFGVLIPKKVIKEDKIKKNQEVKVAIIMKDFELLEKEFGSVKTRAFRRSHKDRAI